MFANYFQEILLSTCSSFSKAGLCNFYTNDNQWLSARERLENACWFGFLEESIPELFIRSSSGSSLFKLYVTASEGFIKIGMNELFQIGEMPLYKKQIESIDPEVISSFTNYN